MLKTTATACGLVVGLLVAAPQASAQIFVDDFESGYLSAWSAVVGAAAVTAYRMADLDLRDPHVFVEALFCTDFTDQDLPFDLAPSFNSSLEMALTGDENEDGFLDASFMVLFRPLDETGVAERVDLAAADCTAPLATSSCVPAAPPTGFVYQAVDTGLCLMTEPGSTSGYSPAIDEPGAICFGSDSRDLTLSLNGVEITLRDARIGASLLGTGPPTSLDSGLLMGFLREADADATTLPADLPVVGGQPLSILLPGGTGNCAAGDDRDLHQEESGWWFYFNFVAEPAIYAE